MGRTVLVAEDEALIRMDLVELLGECGYTVVAAVADGAAAVTKARELRPDVVFLDVAMPRLDGLTAAAQIVSDGIAPVVMVTAFSQSETVARAAEAGALGYLVKPFTRADLAPAIEIAIARWDQVQALAGEVAGLRERQAARETVERAKRLLQEAYGLTEPEAFARLRRAAMDGRITLAEAAAGVAGGLEAGPSTP